MLNFAQPTPQRLSKISNMVQLPKAFIQAMTGLLGPADCQAFSDALQEAAAVSFRPNGRKGFRAADGLSPVAWSSLGYY